MPDFIARRRAGQRINDLAAQNRLIDAANRAAGLTVSAPLELLRTPTGLHLRLAGGPGLRFVRVFPDAIEPGDADRTGHVLDYDVDSGAWIDTVADGDYSPQEIGRLVDPEDAAVYLRNERLVVHFDPESGRHVPIVHPGPHLAVAQEEIARGESGTVRLFEINDAGGEADTEIDVTAYNWFCTRVWDQSPLLVQFLPQSRRWYVAASYSARLLRGRQVGQLLTSDDDNGLDDLVALDGFFPIAGSSTTITAENLLDWEADDGALTYATWNETSASWEMIQVACPA